MPREGTMGPQRGLAGASAPSHPSHTSLNVHSANWYQPSPGCQALHWRWGHQSTEQMETPVFFSGETGKEHTHEIRIKCKMQYPVVSAVKEKQAKEKE